MCSLGFARRWSGRLAGYFLIWQMEFTGTYQIAGDSLLLTFLGLDGANRTRVYSRTTAATTVTHTSWGSAKGQSINTSAN